MTILDLFEKVNLSPKGPEPWGTEVSECAAGVYVVARVGDAKASCESGDLPFIDPFPAGIIVDLEYEQQRWLSSEPGLYIGQTTKRTFHKRLKDFYRHKIGNRSPHAGGQVIKLLRCELWVYWSPIDNPYETEQMMIRAFKKQASQPPYANHNGRRNSKRIQRSS